MASLPKFFSLVLYRTPASRGYRRGTQITGQSQYVDNPVDRVKFGGAREEEAVGIAAGAWMGGMRGAVLMQTSGFATLANALASIAIPCKSANDSCAVSVFARK
jgi:hypothetical protein